MTAQQQAFAHQLVDHGPQRRPRDAEIGGQAAFGRQRVADLQFVEHAQDLVPHERLLAATIGVREPRHLPGAGQYQLVN